MLMTLLFIGSYIAWALLISARFTIVIVLTGGLLFFILRKFLVKAFHLGEGFITSYNQLLKYIDDFWQTVKIAKVHSSEDFYYKNLMRPVLPCSTWNTKCKKTIRCPNLSTG
jgi:ATP-binding cassette, subfamily C, bacterial